MTPEAKARQQIDKLLEKAGWAVQDFKHVNIHAAKGIAIREYQLPGFGAYESTGIETRFTNGLEPYARGGRCLNTSTPS